MITILYWKTNYMYREEVMTSKSKESELHRKYRSCCIRKSRHSRNAAIEAEGRLGVSEIVLFVTINN